MALRLRGRWSQASPDPRRSLPATLHAGEGFLGDTLLEVAPSVTLTLERLGLDGSAAVSQVLRARGARDGTRGPLRISQCAMRGATRTLLSLVADPELPGAAGGFPARAWVVVEGTSFEGFSARLASLIDSALPGVEAAFRGCRFVAAAPTLVRSSQGRLHLRGCAFENRRASYLEDGLPRACTDLLLDAVASARAPSLLDRASQSRSAQYLRSVGVSARTGADLELVGVVHQNTLRRVATDPDPPAVSWDARTVQALQLRACTWLPSEGPPASDGTEALGGRVQVTTDSVRVYSLATRFGGPLGVIGPTPMAVPPLARLGDTTPA
ncbi:MAG: hypothetical protein HY909_06150 [Deltaproteobacteria bacterium]|nr:hypothetical protein [Deltaproteobacteria bacterium]